MAPQLPPRTPRLAYESNPYDIFLYLEVTNALYNAPANSSPAAIAARIHNNASELTPNILKLANSSY